MRALRIGLLLLIVPSTAIAHGEQIIAFPIGQFAALIFVGILAFSVRMTGFQRAILIGLPVVAVPILWFVPGPDQFCPNCGSPAIKRDRGFGKWPKCITCGKELVHSRGGAFYPVCFCTHCGAHLDDDGV